MSFKKVALAFTLSLSILSLTTLTVQSQEYRNIYQEKLDNGLSVVFIDANSADMLLVMFCVSCGSTDEIEKEGIANLLSKIYTKKLNDNGNSLHFGAEINSHVGYDQSIYYVLGKNENLDGILKNFGGIYKNFSVTKSELDLQKRDIEQKISERSGIDKNIIRQESMRSLYWHSKYGSNIEGSFESLKQISEDDIKRFKDSNYANNRVTIIISGNINRQNAMELVKKHFADIKKSESPIIRLQEPTHHESTITVTRYSNQISVPMIEMYWRIPNYRKDKDKALSTEIFINALSDKLQTNLMGNHSNIESVSISYSSWNYDYGDLCIMLTTKSNDYVADVISAVLTEVKSIACDGITKSQADNSVSKMLDSSRFVGHDMFDVIDNISRKISSGHDFDFIVKYPKFARKYDLDEVNKEAKNIFRQDPCVISVIMPNPNAQQRNSAENSNKIMMRQNEAY